MRVCQALRVLWMARVRAPCLPPVRQVARVLCVLWVCRVRRVLPVAWAMCVLRVRQVSRMGIAELFGCLAPAREPAKVAVPLI